jgi:dual specificity phosphatase 12
MTSLINGYVANPADEIVPGLWLGNRVAALDSQWIGEKGIKCVFNCTKDIPFLPQVQRKYRVPVDDNLQPNEIRNLELWSYEVVLKMTREYATGQPMLVHCAAGMQRSAACIAMFLIASKKFTPDEAISFIQERRSIAFRPFINFKNSIESFYKSYQQDIAPKLLVPSTFQ